MKDTYINSKDAFAYLKDTPDTLTGISVILRDLFAGLKDISVTSKDVCVIIMCVCDESKVDSASMKEICDRPKDVFDVVRNLYVRIRYLYAAVKDAEVMSRKCSDGLQDMRAGVKDGQTVTGEQERMPKCVWMIIGRAQDVSRKQDNN